MCIYIVPAHAANDPFIRGPPPHPQPRDRGKRLASVAHAENILPIINVIQYVYMYIRRLFRRHPRPFAFIGDHDCRASISLVSDLYMDIICRHIPECINPQLNCALLESDMTIVRHFYFPDALACIHTHAYIDTLRLAPYRSHTLILLFGIFLTSIHRAL